MTETPVHIIRTSDRGQFKRCRVLWDFTSKMRMNYEYTPGIEPLDFGIAVHAGLEVLYDPTTWNGPPAIRQALCIAAFKESMLGWRKRIREAGQWETMQATYQEHWELGIGMLEHYFLWAPHEDRHYEPIKVEIEFEVPIPVKGPQEYFPYDRGFDVEWEDDVAYLRYRKQRVVYQGRIDLILRDKRDGSLWIYDHKTAAQFGQTEHLELDQQCGSYVWACKTMLGIDIAGVMYGELRKKAPKDPDILKSGAPSKNKSQSTTPEKYREYLRKNNIDEAPYQDFLQTLQNEGQQYFRRITIHRNDSELAALEANIVNEAIDMIDNPRIYPNPSRWNCNGCKMRTPCLIKAEGGDYMWLLENSPLYTKRGSEGSRDGIVIE